jgi:hypothetical protein
MTLTDGILENTMRNLLFVASFLFASSCVAQVVTIQTKVLPDMNTQVLINNNGRTAMTAYSLSALTLNPKSGKPLAKTIVLMDSVANPGEAALSVAPGASAVRNMGHLTVKATGAAVGPQVEVLGAVFADGTTYGDPEDILKYRRGLYTGLQDAISRLQAAIASRLPKESVIADLQSLQKTLRGVDREKRAMSLAYGDAYHNLGKNGDFSLTIDTLKARMRPIAASKPSLD